MIPERARPAAWEDASLAAALFAIDPTGLGGVAVRSGAGPARDAWMAQLQARVAPEAPQRRIPCHIEDERLLGGLDLGASLSAGRPVAQRGVLAECDGGIVILPMAERLGGSTAARVTAAMDLGAVALERDGLTRRLPTRFGLIALDEGIDPDEAPPAALIERLGFHVVLTGLAMRDVAGEGPSVETVARARAALAAVAPAGDAVIEALCRTAQMIGVESARAPLLALRAAQAHAALAGRRRITDEDAAVAARLVLAPRATMAPADPEEPEREEPPSEPADPPPSGEPRPSEPREMDADQIVAAIQAALPTDLFERIKLEGAPQGGPARAGGAGAQAKAARRGRPVGARAGGWRAGDRLNLVETLRAATPWRKLRASASDDGRVQVRKEDFRIRRFVQRQESTTIFVVDASGSAAFQRLAEAKGAVELLLAKAYVSRTRVALVAFRGSEAELLLPPTRSLTRAKRRLADLPGGGGTPLASGIDVALRLALAERSSDRTPLLVLLTDGRANIGRTGLPGRAAANDDALAAARRVREAGVSAAYIDTSPRPRPEGDQIARAMGAVYAPLPYLDASAVFAVVDTLRPSGQERSGR